MTSTEFLTIDQTTVRLGVHHQTIRKMIRQGRLRATRIGSTYRICQADLANFINSNSTPPRVTPEEILEMLEKKT